jgi:hypothetical protein
MEEQQRFAIRKEGDDNAMAVELVGDANTLSNMLASALMSHAEVRQLMMPVFMQLMKDEDFMMVCMQDMMASISPKEEDSDDSITID